MIEISSKEEQLKKLENIIAHSSQTAERHWMEVGKALWKIRHGELYTQPTFEAYCRQRWGFKRSRAYQLCNTYEALKDREKSTVVDTLAGSVPSSELSSKAGMALANVPEEQREEVLTEAKKSGKVTGKSVRAAAAKVFHPDVMEKDKVGREIPEPAMAVWRRKNELRPMTAPLYELKQWAQDMQGTDDLLLRMIDFGSLARQIAQVIFTIHQAVPDVVCTSCQGQAPLTCTLCKGRGMISMSLANQVTPIEMKEMINKRTSKNDKFEKLSVAGG